jgi:subtilisin-like proprotein convertase family protein
VIPLEKIGEFKADFEEKTGYLKIQQFGYDLEIQLISPEGMKKSIKSISYFETTIEIKNVYKQVAGSSVEELTGKWKTTPGEYRLVVKRIDSSKEQTLYEQRFEIEGIEKAKIEISKIARAGTGLVGRLRI